MAGNRGNAENTATHTAADGSVHKSAFPPFDHSTFASQLVWLTIAFAFLYVIISRIALPRVRSLIDARQNTIEGDLAQAMQLKEESNAALSAYEGELASARARAQAIDAEAREKVNQAAVEARESLDADLATRLAEAESRIAASSSIAMSNLREIAIEAAGEIVLRLTGTAPESKSVEAAVDATLKK